MKKLCALFLCVAMCMTMLMAVPFTAQAATTMNISYGFEEEELGVVNVGNGVTYRQQSEVFNDSHFYPQGTPTFEIVEDGYVGQAMKITEDGGKAFQVGLESTNPAAGETAYVNFKLKILEDMGTPTVAIRIGGDQMALFRNEANYPNGPVIFMQGRKDGYYYENNEWYDVTFIFSGDSQRVDLIVKDEKGHIYTGYRNSSSKYPVIRSHDSDTDGAAIAGTSILLDEINIVQGTHDDVLNLVSANYGTISTMNKTVVSTEGFDVPEISNLHNYVNNSAGLSAPALWSSYVTHTMIDDGNGGYAPQLTGISGKQACISSEPAAIEDDKTFVFFRFKPVDQGDGIVAMTLKAATPGGSNGWDVLVRQGRIDTMAYWGSRSDYTFTPGMWYNFVVEFENVGGTNQATLYVYDDQYNKVIHSAPVEGKTPSNGSEEGVINNAIVSVFQYNGSSTWAIDDVKVIKTTEANSEAFICDEFGIKYVNKEVVMEDGFNDSTISNLHNYMGSGSNNGKFVGVGFWANNYYYDLQMVDDCKGGYAPQYRLGAGKTPWLNTVEADFTDTGKAFASMRFKVVDDKTAENGGAPTAIGRFGFGTADSMASLGYELMVRGGVFETWQYWGRQKVPYVLDMWYTIVYEFQYVNGEKIVYLHIYDDQGNEILTGDPAFKLGNPLDAIGNAKMEITMYSAVAGLEPVVAMDDFKVIKTTEADSQAFIKSEILGIGAGADANNGTVYTTTPTFKVNFDQVVGSDSVATFKASGKEDIAGVVRYSDTSSFVDIYPAAPLNYSTKYVLDLSGIKGVNDQGMAETSAKIINFKTAPYTVGTMEVGDAEFADGKLTLPVIFTNEDVEELNVTLIAALYSGDKLVWAETKNVAAANMGDNTFTFTKLPEGADALELKVFAWDNLNTLSPLYK